MKWMLGVVAWLSFLVVASGCTPDVPETVVIRKSVSESLCQPDTYHFPGCECPPYCVFPDSTDVQFVVSYQDPYLGINGDPLVVPTLTSHSGGGLREPLLPLDSTLTFTVELDTNGQVAPSTRIHLAILAVDSAGTGSDSSFGHYHSGPTAKPVGEIYPDTFTTDGTTGKMAVTYTASQYSGPIRLVITSPATDSTLTKHWTVGVPGLVPMTTSGSHITLVGGTTPHPAPLNHFVVPAMIPKLYALADSFYATFHGNLLINDMSLPFGGKFDLASYPYWRSDTAAVGYCWDHCEHRLGRSADIDSLSPVRYAKVVYWWRHLGPDQIEYKESGKAHLRFWSPP